MQQLRYIKYEDTIQINIMAQWLFSRMTEYFVINVRYINYQQMID